MYERAGNHDRAKKVKGTAGDYDIVALINKRLAEERKTIDEGLRKKA